jgi:PAS domain S-box-containing protein
MKFEEADTKISANFYQQVIDSLEDYAVFTTDKNGKITSWNSGAQNILGYTKEEIQGKDSSIFYTTEDVTNNVPKIELKKALNNGRAENERHHVRKDGSQFWGSGLVFPLYNNLGVHFGFTKIMRSLSERKKAEQELQEIREYAESIVDTAKEPLVLLNEDLSIHTANKAFYTLLNEAKEELEGKGIYIICNEVLNIPQLREALFSCVHKNSFFSDLEIELQIRNNENRVYLIEVRKLFKEEHKDELILLAFEDITNRKVLEQQKDDFISIASHELKTPITSIIAYSQILQKRAQILEDSTFMVTVKHINEQARRLTKLIRNLLDISSFQIGNFYLNKEEFDLNAFVAEMASEFRLINKSHKIILKGEISKKIYADKVRIQQVITNLINNAIKFSPQANQIIIRLSSDHDNNIAIISVEDFGIGITLQEQNNLFNRFSRSTKVKTQNISGVGLGLYISLEIAKKHGGNISFESEEGKGTVFTFTIPMNIEN